MREGDIYRWRWADDARHNDSGPYRAYHCYSCIAVVRDGRLCDTFWYGSGTVIDEDLIILTLLGNSNDMTEIREHEARYYRSEDIIDMRHSNCTRAPIYLKAGAQRDTETMQAYVLTEITNAKFELKFAEGRIKDLTECLDQINSGKLDDVRF